MVMQANLVAAVAGGLGLAFVGYCVYFDRKRRSAPDFRKKLIEKRRSARAARQTQYSTQYPDLMDESAVQNFFMKEIALGEQLMGLGDIENGVEHLANAVAVTAHKENLLTMLRQSLPDPIFRMLVERLPVVSSRMFSAYTMNSFSNNKTANMNEETEDELEGHFEREGATITEIFDEQEDQKTNVVKEELCIDELLD